MINALLLTAVLSFQGNPVPQKAYRRTVPMQTYQIALERAKTLREEVSRLRREVLQLRSELAAAKELQSHAR